MDGPLLTPMPPYIVSFLSLCIVQEGLDVGVLGEDEAAA